MIGSLTPSTTDNNTTYHIPKTQLSIHKDAPIGAGGFGIVHHGIWKGNKGHRRVVVKSITTSAAAAAATEKERALLITETKSWLRIKQHPYIVTLWGLSEDDSSNSKRPDLVLVMERMETSLYQRLYPNYQDAAAASTKRDNSTGASFADRIKWITQVAVAMKYLHHGISGGQPVLHLNLKPDNILIDAEGNARISDIGISRHPNYIQTQSRQPNYLFSPPESFSPLPPTKYKPTPAFDVYSFAMTVYQVLSGQGPFDDVFHASFEKVGRWVVEGYRPPRPSTGLVPVYCWALIEECWDQEPGDRPGFSRILEVMQNWK